MVWARYKYFDLKIPASIVANAFCGLHNDQYKKFQPCNHCDFRACLHNLVGKLNFQIGRCNLQF